MMKAIATAIPALPNWPSLGRRATARKRIGVPYRFCEPIDPGQWLSLAPE